MAPIKFEEQLKEKLDKRTLSPSVNSWSKLSQRLDEEENKSKNSIYLWLSIAAGLLIMLAVSVQFFSKNETEKAIEGVVEENVLDKLEDFKTNNADSQKRFELSTEDHRLDLEKENKLEQSKIINYKAVTPKKENTKSQLAKNNNNAVLKTPIIEGASIMKSQEITKSLVLKNTVASTLKSLNAESKLVLDKEVDSLLKLANTVLFNDDLQKSTIKTVDANALLLSVEEDMGQSFRSKVFEALEGSYKTLKTRVVTRKD
ncbi:hypothetical protein OAE07_01425 [Winogradskyella sp.]|nr:hypothetical protein [Winogradskyella sp.]MDC0006614.1 hypothetical protein [Winogradskyella sp.]MDC1505073.1 hypothetical protein [Winogradskyella sp.]